MGEWEVIEWLKYIASVLFPRNAGTDALNRALDGQGRYADRLDARLRFVEEQLAAKSEEVAGCRLKEIEDARKIAALEDRLRSIGGIVDDEK